jgi:hypothetical protein
MIDNWYTVFFTIFMSLWSVLLIDLWQRKQSTLIFHWDCTNLDLNETVRTEFEKNTNKTRKNPITGVNFII